MNLLNAAEVLFAFCAMVAIHEWGHFIAMRLLGVGVEEYCLFFPPRIFSIKLGKTLYSIGSIPLGGFCKPQGGDLSGEAVEKMYEKAPQPGDYLAAAWWKRVLILFAGPGMNYLSAFAIIALVFLVVGKPYSDVKPVLGYVPPGSLAEKAGLQSGDKVLKVGDKAVTYFQDLDGNLPDYGASVTLAVLRNGQTLQAVLQRPPKPAPGTPEPDWGIIDTTPALVGEAMIGQPARNSGVQDGDQIVSINGVKPQDWGQVAYLIRNAKSDPVRFDIRRNGVEHAIDIHRVFTGDYMAVGISAPDQGTKYEKVTLLQSLNYSLGFTLDRSAAILSGIGKLVTGKVSFGDSVAGPITIMRMMYHRAGETLQDFWTLVAGISLMLFLMNLLPIPVVDGGQIVLCFIEGVKHKAVSIKTQVLYQQVGFVLILGLMVLAVFNDFKNIFLEVHNHIH